MTSDSIGSSRSVESASASEIDPTRDTVAYRFDISRISPHGYFAEHEKFGKSLSESSISRLDSNRDLQPGILSKKKYIKDGASISGRKVEDIDAERDHLDRSLSSCKSKRYDQIPDWLKQQTDARVNFSRHTIAAYPELKRTANGKKQY